MKVSLPLCLFLSFFISIAAAQTAHQFKSGLIAPQSHQYGREALYKDQFAYQLFNKTLKTPAENSVLFTSTSGDVKWTSLKADAENRFRGDDLRRAYLYLTYQSDGAKTSILTITNNVMVYVNGEPRAGDLYGAGYLQLPILLKKGLNEFYVRGSMFSAEDGVKASLSFPKEPVYINAADATLPIVRITDENKGSLRAAVVIVNSTASTVKGLTMQSSIEGKKVNTVLPEIPAMTIRKVGFNLDASAISKKGMFSCDLALIKNGKQISQSQVKIEAVNSDEDYSNTFESSIDGSLQYYSVSPQKQPGASSPALFLSVHGAGVEAINQVRAYKSKEEGVLVSPTNRRPRGFNWEDWGRIDALEVLSIAEKTFKPDPKRIYLTGHSMGGHGTWYLGAAFPGKWAAIAPCAGYPSLSAYGSADGKIPIAGKTAIEKTLSQASNASNVYELAKNYKAGGVYIHHGDSDKVVSVDYARQMHALLAGFHKDMAYHEQPGGSHWFGDESVDFQPIFDYFKWHTIPQDTLVNDVDFSTANTSVSSKFHWVSILQQQESLKYSRVKLSRSNDLKTITGTTENTSLLSFALSGLKPGAAVKIKLDSISEISYSVKSDQDILYLKKQSNAWKISIKPDEKQKGTVRNGTFKEPFNNRMIFVYGTKGTKDENDWAYSKARYDAEVWYYRGNGAVDIIADKDFNPSAYPDRGVIIYGNASTNSAYNKLLKNCPIKVDKGLIRAGDKKYTGGNLAAYFMYPRADSKFASVAVIGGTGLEGMHAADANQYFAGGSGFPDYMIFSSELLKNGVEGVMEAGFYDNDWK